MATKLSKLQGSEERENKNCGNQVAENGRKKKRERERIVATKLSEMRGEKKDLGQKLKGKKIVTIDLWQWNYRNGRKKK